MKRLASFANIMVSDILYTVHYVSPLYILCLEGGPKIDPSGTPQIILALS